MQFIWHYDNWATYDTESVRSASPFNRITLKNRWQMITLINAFNLSKYFLTLNTFINLLCVDKTDKC